MICALVLSLAAGRAHAVRLGIDGYTGKQGATCGACHTGGGAPTVQIQGPTTINAGADVAYTFRVQTGAAITGMAVAATDGIKLLPGTGTMEQFAEVVQSAPRAPTGGAATYGFSVRAMYGGTIKLWAVGLAANNNNGVGGDGAAATTLDVTVNGPPPPPPDMAKPPSDMAGAPTDMAGATDLAGTPPAADGGTNNGSDLGGGGGGGGGGGKGDGGTGERPYMPGCDMGGTAPPAGALMLVMLLVLWVRQKRQNP
jgi:hypothetical protein